MEEKVINFDQWLEFASSTEFATSANPNSRQQKMFTTLRDALLRAKEKGTKALLLGKLAKLLGEAFGCTRQTAYSSILNFIDGGHLPTGWEKGSIEVKKRHLAAIVLKD